jgi:hypothetical protein
MRGIPFGGPLGAVLDPSMGITLHPRVDGQASVGDEARDDVVQAAPAVLVRHLGQQVGQWFASRKGMHPTAMVAELTGSVAAAASAELGVMIQIHQLNVAFSDEDRAQLQALAAEKRRAVAATLASPVVPAPPPPAAVAPYGAAPIASPSAAGTPTNPAKKKSGALYALLGGGVVVLAIVFGLVWHFTHEHASAPAAHEHTQHGKH